MTAARLRVTVLNTAGTVQGNAPLTDILGASYTLTLDAIGSFTLDVGIADPILAKVTVGFELDFYREGEGLVFKGLVDKVEFQAGADNKLVAKITGGSLGRQLAFANTLLGDAFQGATLATTFSSLLTGTGWASGSLGVPTNLITYRFDGATIWEALVKVSEIPLYHVRENPYNKTVDANVFGTYRNIVLRNVPAAGPNIVDSVPLAGATYIVPIAAVRISDEAQDLWNKVVPVGSGVGEAQLTLRWATRSSPYTVQNATGPDGRTYYFLSDATSIAAYGTRTQVLSVPSATPLANSPAGFTAAANALYDVAATWLQRRKDIHSVYDVTTVGLTHFDSAAAVRLAVGDKLRLVYNGNVTLRDGTTLAWRQVDTQLFLMGFTRTFLENGTDTWKLTLSTLDRAQNSAANQLTSLLSNMFVIQTALHPYTYREIHGPERQSLDSGSSKTMTMTATWDGNAQYLLQSKLEFIINAMRSNVSTAAAEASHTHTVSGSTSSAGSSHSHSVSGQTATQSGSTTTPVWGSGVASSGPSNNTTASNSPSTSHSHSSPAGNWSVDTGNLTNANSVDHTHTMQNHTHSAGLAVDVANATHTHPVNATTSASEASHTHTVSGSTSAAGTSHTHALVYGVFDDTTPSNPLVAVTVNGTAITGSPFNTVGSKIEVDVTALLQDGNGQILRQSNPIVFTVGKAATHLDVEATLRSLVTATSLVPV